MTTLVLTSATARIAAGHSLTSKLTPKRSRTAAEAALERLARSSVTALGKPRRASSSTATAEQIWPDVQ